MVYRKKGGKAGENREGFAFMVSEQKKIPHRTGGTEGTRSANAPLKRATAPGRRPPGSGLGKG